MLRQMLCCLRQGVCRERKSEVLIVQSYVVLSSPSVAEPRLEHRVVISAFLQPS